MSPLHIELPSRPSYSYPVWIAPNLLEQASLWLPKNKSATVILTEDEVKKHYASQLTASLQATGHPPLLFDFPAGEASKTIHTKCDLETKMLKHGCDRDSLILALGGGVVGDLAGFIAATYMRGIDYVHVPTTLLAMIDSAIGGKTAIDTPMGKNLIGAFWQPQAVICDIHCLRTLPKKQLINGLIEGYKLFIARDLQALNRLENHLEAILNLEDAQLLPFIQHAVRLKAEIVQQDEKEAKERAILNLGHTVGHALEQLSGYQLLHGYAVALGLLVEAKMAELMGLLPTDHFESIEHFLLRLDINRTQLIPFHDPERIIQSMQTDKKKRANLIHYVLLEERGKVHEIDGRFTHPVPEALFRQAMRELTGVR